MSQGRPGRFGFYEETCVSDAQEFVDRVREDLLSLEQRINCFPENAEGTDGVRFDSLIDARSIVGYLERVALKSRQFEIAGLCRFVYEGYGKVREVEKQASDRPSQVELIERELRGKEWLTPTDIGQITEPGLHPAVVNLLLKELGFIVPSAGGWIATEQGLAHASQHAVREGRKPYVLWRRSILQHVRKAIEEELVETLPNPWVNCGRRPSSA